KTTGSHADKRGGAGGQGGVGRRLRGFDPDKYRELKELKKIEIAERCETDNGLLQTVVACKLYTRLLYSTQGAGLFFDLTSFVSAGLAGDSNGEFHALS